MADPRRLQGAGQYSSFHDQGYQPGEDVPPYQQPQPYAQGGYQQPPYSQGGYQQPQPQPYAQGGYQQPPYSQGGYQQPPPQPYTQGGYQQQQPYTQGGYQQPQPYTQGGYQQQPQQHGGGGRQSDGFKQYNDRTYEYDTYNIQYHEASVDGWGEVQNDQSAYSQYWETPQAFEPKTFSRNTKKSATCNDVVWAILFWLNFLGVAILGVIVLMKSSEKMAELDNVVRDTYEPTIDDLPLDMVLKMLGIGLGVAVVVNILHYVFLACAPMLYVHFGMLASVFLSIIVAIVLAVYGIYYGIFGPVITTLFSIIVYFVSRKFFAMTAAVLQVTSKIVCRYPSIFCLVVLQGVLQVVLSGGFIALAYGIAYIDWSLWIYIYILFSYFWVTLTFMYVTYMTCCGLGASWYFLNETEHFPNSPVWESFKRAATTSFGSAAFVGLLLAVIETLKALVKSESSDNKGCANILRCIAMCILTVLESCIRWIAKYALIYCATFGVPFKEGCRRWAELSCKKFVDVLMGGCIVQRCLNIMLFLVAIISGAGGFGIGYLMSDDDNYLVETVTMFVSLLMSITIFVTITTPMESISDTLLVCFSEAPDRLLTSARDLHSKLSEFYSAEIRAQVNKRRQT